MTMERLISHSFPTISSEEKIALEQVLESSFLKGGTFRDKLEQTVARDQSYQYAVTTTSGTQAIHLALRTVFPRGGARVAVQSYLCRSVYDGVILAGCIPVLVDVDPVYLGPDITSCSKDIDVVIVPHLFGIQVPLESYLNSGILVVEDCAQRISSRSSATHDELKGDIRILSFEGTKYITSGEGGMILLNQKEWHNRAHNLRDGSYDFHEPALWLPMTDLQAAVAFEQWKKLDYFIKRRRLIAERYLQSLEGGEQYRITPQMKLDNNLFFRFLLNVDDPDLWIELAGKYRVVFRKPIAPVNVHRLYNVKGHFSVSEQTISSTLSIPIYPALNDDEVNRIITTVHSIDKSFYSIKKQ